MDKKALKERVLLSDEQLKNVTGGFVSVSSWSAGWEIICPNCGAENMYEFDTWIASDDDRLDGFQCRHCMYTFGVDSEGRYWGNI